MRSLGYPGMPLCRRHLSPTHTETRPVDRARANDISQPTVVAMMTEALELDGRQRVLEIGTGSGYQAAILSLLSRHVDSIEILPQLGDVARRPACPIRVCQRRRAHRRRLPRMAAGSSVRPDRAHRSTTQDAPGARRPAGRRGDSSSRRWAGSERGKSSYDCARKTAPSRRSVWVRCASSPWCTACTARETEKNGGARAIGNICVMLRAPVKENPYASFRRERDRRLRTFFGGVRRGFGEPTRHLRSGSARRRYPGRTEPRRRY